MKKINDTVIKDCISANVKDLNSVFVFPTQICAAMWADKTLEFSGTACVALERFIAWDEFKGSSIRSQHQDKNSIPSTLRTVFAENLVLQNSKTPFLKNIITQKYAQSAGRFATWIAGILPSLAMWKKNFDKKKIKADDEDLDFLEVYDRYKQFLDKNNMFDPAWETPPFKPDGNKYFIFFPEILMDYAEYKDILESSEDIHLVHISDETYAAQKPDGHFYSNTRIELKDVMHYLWNVHNEQNIPWNKIAISVPDMDNYGPYLERDLDIYEIPHVLKNGKALSSNGAGLLFSELQQCHAEDYSFETIKNLLLNKELPWTDDAPIDALIKFGRENSCLCSYEYNGTKVDVWNESFKHPVDSSYVEQLEPFYNTLKKLTDKIVESKSFTELRTNYFTFREKFFDFSKADFPPENDRILSRCISELGGLIDLEEKFGQCGIFEIPSCFGFFCDYLGDKMYVPQNESNGVQILPYRTAACAPFDVHVIVDASQSNTSVVYKQLSFLRDDKRKQLGFVDDSNITENFILLYAMNAQKDIFFTCSQKTIDAYAFTNSYLNQIDHRIGEREYVPPLMKNDSFTEELNSYLEMKKDSVPGTVFKIQKTGFEKWSKCERTEGKISGDAQTVIDTKIENKLIQNEKVCVTVTDLKRFYECPRSFLYSKVFGIYEKDNEAVLIDHYDMGNLYHHILQLYFTLLKKEDAAVEFDTGSKSISKEQQKLLLKSVKDGIESFKVSHLSKQLLKSSVKAIENAVIYAVNKFSEKFNGFKIYAVEEEYRWQEETFAFLTRIDCILSSPDGELVIVDFKTTKNSFPKDAYWDGTEEGTVNFQLPVYKYVFDKYLKDSQKVSACLFYSIKDGVFLVPYSEIDQFKPKETNEAFESTQNRCLELSKLYAEYVSEHDFSPSIVDLNYSDCSHCTYKSVCRRSFTVSNARD